MIDETIECAALTDDRIDVLSNRAGGHAVGAPATRDEERSMALEIWKARAQRREAKLYDYNTHEVCCNCEACDAYEQGYEQGYAKGFGEPR